MRAETQPVASPVAGIAAALGAFDLVPGGRRVPGEAAIRSDPAPRTDAAMAAARRDLGLEALCRAQILIFIGQPSAALDLLHETLQSVREAGDDTLLVAIQMARLRMLEMQPHARDIAALRIEILGIARRLGFVGSVAADAGCAVSPGAKETGRPAVRDAPGLPQSGPVEFKTEAPPDAGAPIRIRTLGAFGVLVRGQPFVCGRKAPHKPLALLQALIALGGHNVAATVVVDALWPDADGGCGRRSLDVALLRLRRLLGRDDAILVSGGRLSINPELCWIDAWAFERAVDAAEDLGPGSTPERLRQVADTVISLYQGRFLGAEEDRPWMMPARDRLAAKFARAVGSCARALVAAGLSHEAEAFYRRGLELDNLSEALYRGLMDCCAEQGHRAEAINAYRRCRELLSIVLNTRPSEQTELLYRRLSAG